MKMVLTCKKCEGSGCYDCFETGERNPSNKDVARYSKAKMEQLQCLVYDLKGCFEALEFRLNTQEGSK